MAKQWHQLEKLDHKALKKLQAEREKQRELAQKAEEQKKYVIIATIVIVIVIMIGGFGAMINKKKKELAYKEAREKLFVSTVLNIAGTPEFRKIGLWEPLYDKTDFDTDVSFRTPSPNDSVTVVSILGNTIKALGDTEFHLPKRVLAETENKVEKELAELMHGEITVTIDLEGRDILEIKAPGITVLARSGLFKVLYDRDKDYGEVVVKNGLVEVKSDLSLAEITPGQGSGTKVSGFYKVVFSATKVDNPVQASVIQYDWR